MRSLVALLCLLVSGSCQAAIIAGGTVTATPSRPASNASVVFTETIVGAPCLIVPFGCAGEPPALPPVIGGTIRVEPGFILVDLFAGYGVLPEGVRPLQATFARLAVFNEATTTIDVGALAPATYVVGTRLHELGVDGSVQSSIDGGATILDVHDTALPVEQTHAVEFYNAALDHYFLSADPGEIADLDAGVHPGWVRTGEGFNVYPPQRSGGAGVPVCRFYGLPSAGLNSHFYTSDAQECLGIPAKFGGAWQPEAVNAFEVVPLSAPGATCPAGTAPVYRLWNRRSDSNHRYTTSRDVALVMVSRGWFWEGGQNAFGVLVSSPSGVMCTSG